MVAIEEHKFVPHGALSDLCKHCGAVEKSAIHGVREGDQRLPVASDAPISHEEVIADLRKRLEVGIQRYGRPLQAHNGRNTFLDIYEEMLDAAVYLKTLQIERDDYAQKIIAVLNGDNGQQAKALLREILTWLEA